MAIDETLFALSLRCCCAFPLPNAVKQRDPTRPIGPEQKSTPSLLKISFFHFSFLSVVRNLRCPYWWWFLRASGLLLFWVHAQLVFPIHDWLRLRIWPSYACPGDWARCSAALDFFPTETTRKCHQQDFLVNWKVLEGMRKTWSHIGHIKSCFLWISLRCFMILLSGRRSW